MRNSPHQCPVTVRPHRNGEALAPAQFPPGMGLPPSVVESGSAGSSSPPYAVPVEVVLVVESGGVTFPPGIGDPLSWRIPAGERGVSVLPGEQAAKRTGTAKSDSTRESRLISTFLCYGNRLLSDAWSRPVKASSVPCAGAPRLRRREPAHDADIRSIRLRWRGLPFFLSR